MRRALLALALAIAPLGAQVSDALRAKFVKIILANASSAGRIAIEDPALTKALTNLGVHADPGAKVAYAATEAEVVAHKAAGKLVICPDLTWLPKGASIAIADENGRASIYLHTGHIQASGVKVSPAILRIGRN